MSLVGISIVKNEADIIEAFVRHNLLFLDRMIVVDHDSGDSTKDILLRLASEGLPLELRDFNGAGHQQTSVLNQLITELAADTGTEFIFPLDADELLAAAGRRALTDALSQLAPGVCASIRWCTFVPTPKDDWSEVNPVRRIKHHRTRESGDCFKVALPRNIAREAVLTPGNHYAHRHDGSSHPHQELSNTLLAHFPVRSPDQIVAKAMIGEWSLRQKIDRLPSEGWHWDDITRRLMSGTTIDHAELMELATSYIGAESSELMLDPVSSVPQTSLRYADLIDTNTLRKIVHYTDRLVERIQIGQPSATDQFGDAQKRAGRYRQQISTNHVVVKECRHGTFAFHKHDAIIGRSMDLCGEWGKEELDTLLQLIRPGQVVLDVGANIGTRTVPFARSVGTNGWVHAFEPQRLTHQVLCGNVALNGLQNVTAHWLALGADDGEVNVPIIPLGTVANIGSLNIESHRSGDIVAQRRLDSLNLPRVDLIKIDVEGMECKVISGAAHTIKQCRPILFVENNIAEKSASLIEMIMALGYRCWWHMAPYFSPNNWARHQENFIYTDRPEINMLCFPMERGIDVRGAQQVLGPQDTWKSAWERSQL